MTTHTHLGDDHLLTGVSTVPHEQPDVEDEASADEWHAADIASAKRAEHQALRAGSRSHCPLPPPRPSPKDDPVRLAHRRRFDATRTYLSNHLSVESLRQVYMETQRFYNGQLADQR